MVTFYFYGFTIIFPIIVIEQFRILTFCNQRISLRACLGIQCQSKPFPLKGLIFFLASTAEFIKCEFIVHYTFEDRKGVKRHSN